MTEPKVKNIASSGQPVLLAYPAYQGSGVSLLDICRVLWRKKRLIAGSFFACTVMAAVLGFSLPKIYRTEATLLPPSVSDVVKLNVPGVYEAESKRIYSEFLKNLQSSGVRYSFFSSDSLADELKAIDRRPGSDYLIFKEKFDDRVQVVANRKRGKNAIFRTVRLDGENARNITRWLDGYIKYVDRYTVHDVVSGIRSQMLEKVAGLKSRIEALRQVARQQRLGRIEQLKEAIAIATRLNISEFTGSPFVSINQSRNTSDNVDIVSNSEETPLYFRGYKALRIELEQLEKRKNDDPYILGLRELQEELAFLSKKRISSDDIHAVRVDQNPIVPSVPIAPRRTLIIAMGGIIGLMLGIFITLIKNMSEVA